MAGILDELEGILSPAEVAKLRTSPFAARIERGDEVRAFYDGDVDTPPAPPARREAPPTEHRPASGTGDSDTLAQIMARLDGLGDIDKRVEEKVKTIVEQRGSELRGGAVADSIRITRELSKLDARHRADFGEDLDDEKLNAHIAAAREQGRPFRTVADAYEDMTREARINARVETTVRERLKQENSGRNLPGNTAPAATPMLSLLRGSGRKPGDAGTTADKAAAALTARLAERGEIVA
jgi:hypothetical protein